MKITQFSDKKTGKLVPITILTGAEYAFLPNPLPPNWELPRELSPLLVEARSELARLDGVGINLPNPQLLLRPLQYREAHKSLELEGTITVPEEQLLFELEPKLPLSSTDEINDYREVYNYSRALRMGVSQEERLPLSLRLIRQFHRILLDGVRGSEFEPGEFRRVQNVIGRPIKYIPPPQNHLPETLDYFEKYLHQKRIFDALVDSFLVHYQFEAIHPFMDGNGRVGRLLLSVMIQEWCKLSNQWLYMSAYFDANKDEYRDRLFRISAVGEWSEWIEFCLQGVIVQAMDAQGRCTKLLNLEEEYKVRIQGIRGSYRLNRIVEQLFVSPVVTISRLARTYDVLYPTTKADVDKLIKVGILELLPETYPKAFFAPEIYQITYED
jgi:Fic family protein